jgi:Mrp family chromosome partitioning ATPase
MRSILETLRTQYGHVVVDAPAALSNGDLAMLAPLVDRFVVVVRAGITDRSAVQDTVAALDPSRLLGVVLNATA